GQHCKAEERHVGVVVTNQWRRGQSECAFAEEVDRLVLVTHAAIWRSATRCGHCRSIIAVVSAPFCNGRAGMDAITERAPSFLAGSEQKVNIFQERRAPRGGSKAPVRHWGSVAL